MLVQIGRMEGTEVDGLDPDVIPSFISVPLSSLSRLAYESATVIYQCIKNKLVRLLTKIKSHLIIYHRVRSNKSKRAWLREFYAALFIGYD